MGEASIVLKAYDEISGTMKSVENNSHALDKEFEVLQSRIQQLGKKNDSFNKSFAETSTQVTAAKKALKEAEAAFKSSGDEQSRLNLDNAKKQYKDLTDAAKAYEEASRSTRKEISSTQEQMRKLGNESGGSSGSLLKGLMTAGLGQMVGSSVQDYTNYLMTSAAGSQTGSLLSGILGGAISGGSLGAMTANPYGIAIGAAVGGASGLVQGITANESSKDDAFKSYVQDAYKTVTEQQTDDITSGTATAAQREQDAIAFNQLLGKGKGDSYLKNLQTLASTTPLEYSDLTSMSRALATGFGSDPTRMLELMKNLGDAGSAVGIDASGMTTMAQALSRMQSSGKATLEYLNIFQDRGVDVIGILGKALGKTQGQIYDMISKGKISGVTAVKDIQDAMNVMYDGAMEKQSKTYAGVKSTLEDAQTEVNAAYGTGYTQEKQKGMQEQIDYLSGSGGTRIKKANELIGAWEASLENAKDQYIRDAQDQAMQSNAYREAQAQKDGLKMGEILKRAQIQGMNEYNASEGAQLELESQKSLIGTIRDDSSLNNDYWQTGYDLGQQFNKGRASGIGNSTKDFAPTAVGDWSVSASSHAFGLSYVPYDNYPALLHQGERVQTAAEARQKSGGGAKVSFAGAVFNVRQDSDIDAIVDKIATKLERSALAGAEG